MVSLVLSFRGHVNLRIGCHIRRGWGRGGVPKLIYKTKAIFTWFEGVLKPNSISAEIYLLTNLNNQIVIELKSDAKTFARIRALFSNH